MYVDTMARTVHGLFKQYHADLTGPKLLLPGLGKHDLIAADEGSLKSLFTKKVDLSKRAGLSLGDRARVLRRPDAPPVIVHVAEAEGKKFHYEALFRSVQKHLMDTATSEFLFLLDFFLVDQAPAEARAGDATKMCWGGG